MAEKPAPMTMTFLPATSISRMLKDSDKAKGIMQACGDKLVALRQARVVSGYELDDVLHLYSFYNALRDAAREVRAECVRRRGENPPPPLVG